jgi:hypothetical protein
VARGGKAAGARPPSNHISEWFGHRIYPQVRLGEASVGTLTDERCPFLSAAVGEAKTCVKGVNAKGVCTISTQPNGADRRDWLVCPYRALDPALMRTFVGRLFGMAEGAGALIIPGLKLAGEATRGDVAARLAAGERVFIYFDEKLGGELSVPGGDSSPEFSFDVTVFEIVLHEGEPTIDRFGIVEIQTMDFHGGYGHAVTKLRAALDLFPTDFPAQIAARPDWMGERIEGPNIANVFKRTFYQMMFKFQMTQHPQCAGCVLAIPHAVWQSWAPHLGRPVPVAHGDGTEDLFKPGTARPDHVPAWIIVFDLDADAEASPSPIRIRHTIATDAPSIGHAALVVAPEGSLARIGTTTGMLGLARRRIMKFWPELGHRMKF